MSQRDSALAVIGIGGEELLELSQSPDITGHARLGEGTALGQAGARAGAELLHLLDRHGVLTGARQSICQTVAGELVVGLAGDDPTQLGCGLFGVARTQQADAQILTQSQIIRQLHQGGHQIWCGLGGLSRAVQRFPQRASGPEVAWIGLQPLLQLVDAQIVNGGRGWCIRGGRRIPQPSRCFLDLTRCQQSARQSLCELWLVGVCGDQTPQSRHRDNGPSRRDQGLGPLQLLFGRQGSNGSGRVEPSHGFGRIADLEGCAPCFDVDTAFPDCACLRKCAGQSQADQQCQKSLFHGACSKAAAKRGSASV